MPLSYIVAYLEVACDEGKGVADYASKVDVSPTVMTRNLLDIGDRNRQREEGYGLITQERDLFDLRKHNARITPKGQVNHQSLQARPADDAEGSVSYEDITVIAAGLIVIAALVVCAALQGP
jgi:DNA-binding MarR family transcriptional regulator